MRAERYFHICDCTAQVPCPVGRRLFDAGDTAGLKRHLSDTLEAPVTPQSLERRRRYRDNAYERPAVMVRPNCPSCGKALTRAPTGVRPGEPPPKSVTFLCWQCGPDSVTRVVFSDHK